MTNATEGVTKGIPIGEYIPDVKLRIGCAECETQSTYTTQLHREPRRTVYGTLGKSGHVMMERVSRYNKDGRYVKGNSEFQSKETRVM